jgi:hypothetical protein
MKTPALPAALSLAVALAATACSSNRGAPPPPPPGPPVTVAGPARPAAALAGAADGSYAHTQRLYGDASAALVSSAQAQQIVNEFRVAYEGALKKPRMLIYINRDLVAPPDKNVVVKTTGTVTGRSAVSTTTTSAAKAAKSAAEPAWSLADRQTARDIERLTARPYRAAGAAFADQKIAASMLPDSSVTSHAELNRYLVTEAGRKDREALAKVTDIVIEVLLSSRHLTVQQVSGAQTVAVPDIQMTAIRLSDAAILGQASSLELIGPTPPSSAFDVQTVTESTALVLMQDITATAK